MDDRHFHLSFMSLAIFFAMYIISSFIMRFMMIWLASRGEGGSKWAEALAVLH